MKQMNLATQGEPARPHKVEKQKERRSQKKDEGKINTSVKTMSLTKKPKRHPALQNSTYFFANTPI